MRGATEEHDLPWPLLITWSYLVAPSLKPFSSKVKHLLALPAQAAELPHPELAPCNLYGAGVGVGGGGGWNPRTSRIGNTTTHQNFL